MLRSIATVSLSGTLPEKLEAIAAAGFDGVEIFENDLLCHDGSPRSVRTLCADLGLAITLFQPFRDFEGAPRDRLPGNLDRAERKFDLMQELGTDLMLVCSNSAADSLGDPHILRDDLRLLAERAAARRLRIAYEGLAWGRHVNTWQQVWALVREVDHPALGMVLDSFHTQALKGDVDALADIPGDRIFFVQMADAPLLAMDVQEWSRHFRCFPGQGDFDQPGFLAPILRSGYRGPLSLEIFNDRFRAAPTGKTAVDGLRSLLYLEEKTRQLLARDPRPLTCELLFNPPAASRYGGVEWIEFAVDGVHGKRLANWLEQLGFVRLGPHRSKAVSLWEQGEVRIMLNAEPDGFAHDFFSAHGPSVCGIGVQVENSQRSLDRAEAFKASSDPGLSEQDDWGIPAVEAPDGSRIYLVSGADNGRSTYAWDFLIETPVETPESGLQRIDHVAMALAANNLDSAALFYKSVFDFNADPEVALPDPYGLEQSRVLRSPCGSIRLPLNRSDNRDTAIAHTLSAYQGAGVEHIAFACDDIFAQVRRARDAGLPLLEIPQNYYGDLAARFGFDDRFVNELARYNVLYDRDARGAELFHVYTETFDGRFFFEILQRKQGYQGDGAANDPLRLAAMARAHRRRAASQERN